MNIFQAVVLGIVQGFTEFLPISSSAHLYLVPHFLHWQDPGLEFDIALHWGTLLAVLVFFGKDYWKYARAFILVLFRRSGGITETEKFDSKLAWFIILACIPGAIFGLLLEDQAATVFRNPLLQAFTLAGFGFVLWLVDKRAKLQGSLSDITWKKALGIGCAQALAVIPGVSRSGSTITAGLLSRLDRETATRFSFLLSGPIIFGAGLVAIPKLAGITPELIWGFIASAIAGGLAIKFLLKYLASHSFKIFVWYRYLAALVILLLLWLKI